MALRGLVIFFFTVVVQAEEWVEIGADAVAVYYVDVDSIDVLIDSVRVIKQGVYNHVITENLGGEPRVFRKTRGVVEMDCRLRLNRVVEIDMLDENDVSVWSSGVMRNRPWEKVLDNTHAEKTMDLICNRLSKT